MANNFVLYPLRFSLLMSVLQFSHLRVRSLPWWDAEDLQGASAPVVYLVISGWFEVVLWRSVWYGHWFQQLVLAYVMDFSLDCIELLHWVVICNMSYAPWYLYLGFLSLGLPYVEQVTVQEVGESDIFCYWFLDVGNFMQSTGIFITKPTYFIVRRA